METNAQYFDCLCRTCMNKVEASSQDGTTKPQQQWLSIFDIIEECGALRITELLSDAVPQIVVQPSDELPKKICSECLQRLLSVYWFQKMCVQSDKEMHALFCKKQTVLKTPMLEEAIKDETETNAVDLQPLEEWAYSSTLQNLQQPPIQEPLAEVTVQTIEPEASQSSPADHLQDNTQLQALCNDSQSEFEEFIKNEPIEDEANSEYSDDDTIHSIISVTKDDPIEPEDQQVNDASSRHNCHLCNKSYKHRQHLIKHLKDHKEKAKNSKEYCFACHLCSESYKGQRYLSRHLKLAHSIEPQQYTCDVCNKSFAYPSRLREHIRTHTGERPSFTTKRHLTKHNEDKPYECPSCPLRFNSRSGLWAHKKSHEEAKHHNKDKPYECPYCPLRFNSRSGLWAHKKSHEEAKLHECDICGKDFMTIPSLIQHKLIHSEEKPHKCDVCEKRFTHMQQLKSHIRSHTGEKPYKCKYCELGFATHSSLSQHLHSHLGKNIYRCKFCPLAFPSSAEMRSHLITHKNEDQEVRERNLKALQEEEAKLKLKILKEKSKKESTEEQQQKKLSNKEMEQPSTDNLAKQRTAEEKPYECPYCPLRFNSKSNLGSHKTIHDGIRRHNCSICGKQFRRKSDLTLHERIHSKEKPHKCDLCQKRFAQPQHLKIHIRTHTGEKPLKCKYCERGFVSRSLLNIHLRRHLGENIHRCKFCPLAFPSYAEMRLHLTSHKNEDQETRERNLKALMEEEARITSKERAEWQSKKEQQKEFEQQSTEWGECEEFIKDKPIEDGADNTEYSDGDTMNSTISVTKNEALSMESEYQQVDKPRDEFEEFIKN